MGRKVQITKEQMLEAGLRLIIRDGYSALNIKTVANEIKCSTQPIAWSFGNIDSYRKELRKYATQYMSQKMSEGGIATAEDRRRTGRVYVDMAIDEPNLIRYLRLDEEDLQKSGGIGFIFDNGKNVLFRKKWAETMGLSEEEAVKFVKFVTVYTEGVVSMIVSGAIAPDREAAHRMIDEAGESYMAFLKSQREEV